MSPQPPASADNSVPAMSCSQVLAETPESVPSIGRFVTAAYLWPVKAVWVCWIPHALRVMDSRAWREAFSRHLPPHLSCQETPRTKSFIFAVVNQEKTSHCLANTASAWRPKR